MLTFDEILRRWFGARGCCGMEGGSCLTPLVPRPRWPLRRVLILAGLLLPTLALAQPGTLDTTFGNGGTVLADFGGHEDGWSVALQRDGKIVAAGGTFDDGTHVGKFALARFERHGTPDPTFGVGGQVTTSIGTNDFANGVAVQGDGRIVAAGLSTVGPPGMATHRFAVARYMADGSLDPSFGTGGKAIADFGGTSSVGLALALQKDGRIVLAGYNITGTPPKVQAAVARFTSAGQLDPSFGVNGQQTILVGSGTQAWAVTTQKDGKIVLGGTIDSQFAVLRLTRSGNLDTRFGSMGSQVAAFPGRSSIAMAVAIQKDGRIVAAGSAEGTQPIYALARFTTSGRLDSTFGDHGLVTTGFGGTGDAANGLTIQKDGRIVAVGESFDATGSGDFSLARYLSSGRLDGRFGSGGKVIQDLGGSDEGAVGIAIQKDGRMVVVGFTDAGPNPRNFALARFTAK